MISEKTLHTLELDKILARLADQSSFSAGKDAAVALRPSSELSVAQSRLRQTSEARLLLDSHPSVHLGGAHDIRDAVRRAEVSAVLTPSEFLEVGSTLGAASRVRSVVTKTELDVPWLRNRVGRMAEMRDLVQSIEQTFSDNGEVLDSASGELRRLRQEMRSAQGRLMDRLQSMIASATTRSALQEPIVTMRNGRYVIPVRQDARSKVPGVVHDQSSSGQTLFVEPLAVTEMNNRLKELELAEQREIERILAELSNMVAEAADELRRTVDALVDVDVAFAKAKFAAAGKANEPKLNAEGRVNLVHARHPLLTGNVVPITLRLGGEFRLLVITGPNTGGKTVALKTTGLLTLMAQTGLHVPAAGESEVAVFSKVFADIGDEQSIEQNLSTFSSHMGNIIEMMPEVDGDSLVLLDELGAGTDPAEGAALARALLNTLLETGAKGVITTHYSELKTFAHEESGVENASVEFNVKTLSPTYRLTIGLPGRSQALAIARRLGMTERVLERARQNVSAGAVQVEKLLAQIQWERAEIGRLYQRSRELHADTKKLRDRVKRELGEVAVEREKILAAARDEAAEAVRDLRGRLRELETEAKAVASRREQREIRGRVDEIQTLASEALGPLPSTVAASIDPEAVLQPLRAGSTVDVLSLGQKATVVSLSNGEAEVQLGQFKMRVPTSDLQVVAGKQRQEVERAVEYHATRDAPEMQIDVRGWRADEAIRELDQYLHDNYMHGQGTVRILHGKGTGALRKAIREQLDEHPLVKSHQSEETKQGGEGVTVVQLAV